MARGFTAFGLVLVVAGIGAYWRSRPEPIPPAFGDLRATEVGIHNGLLSRYFHTIANIPP